MKTNDLYDIIAQNPKIAIVREQLRRGGEKHLLLSGLYGSARAMVILAAGQSGREAERLKGQRSLCVVMDNEEEARYMFGDLRQISQPDDVFFFPTSRRKRQGVDEAMAIQRTEVLTQLSVDVPKVNPLCTLIVTYPEALMESVPAKEELIHQTLHLNMGMEMELSHLSQQLLDLGFVRVDFVYEPGQFAIRGGIVDVYSYSHEDPYRLDMFGNEVERIHTFDIENQLSKERVDAICITSGDGNKETGNEASLMDYLPKDTVWISNDWSLVNYKLNSLENGNKVSYSLENGTTGSYSLEKKETIELRDKSTFATYDEIHFNTLPQPTFNKNFEILSEDIRQRKEAGYHICILADQHKQTDRLTAILESLASQTTLEDNQAEPIFQPVEGTMHAGWIDHEAKIVCYTDHEIFERYHRVALRSENARRGKAVVTLKEINQLQIGDFVVHSDHGVGQFGGLVTTTVNGKPQEMIRLNYRDGDTIFVSIHNLHRISKYKGREGTQPTISKLGSGAWERLKERTKDKVKDIARDLIQLYAQRKNQPGFAYTPDGYMQQELEASFLYEDTPDQAKATLDVKRDMESPKPMDRLICGDVGFGKTEVAMRAAFKAATDGKQVAVLVPTTVLALQHYQSFTERLHHFPVRIAYLSRAKTAQQTRDILTDLATGKIDILIGTHKIIGKNVVWKDLGLLIIDEEQKFGVAVKEKLKSLRANIDVLTLTATPIPRTLQFSMLGARDLSVMTTPPPNRYPVQTEMINLDDEDIIQEAIELEMERNGQVFVVNNRIEMLPRIENLIHKLCPKARVITAHGQMPMEEMEQRLEAFINYDYDVLVSTTIIESGVDIPNVNTMIIFSAQHFGLADLHQLRGRVGRSNRKAYCYLITPDRELLTPDARRRLDAICTFAELGSGFNLAMQDLDIRGAGNLLGAEQSGFIADLGYDTYQKVLNEAVEELKSEMGVEQSHESNDEDSALKAENQIGNWCSDAQLETDIPVSFPSEYIENISERITLYRELDGLRNEEEMTAYQKRLIDRFGPLPQEAEELMNVVRLRWLCCQLGIEKIYLKGEKMSLFMVSHREDYWHSKAFEKIITFMVKRPEKCQFREGTDSKGRKNGKKYMMIGQVRTIAGAIHLISKIANDE